MNLINTYEHKGTGFTPLFINDKWQVAQINYDPNEPRVSNIDIHFETDELFILLEGTAILIAAEKNGKDDFIFETVKMKCNVVYNIPRMTWHNIAVLPEAKILIFENKDSHLGKYERRRLRETQTKELNQLINETLKGKLYPINYNTHYCNYK